MATKVTQPELAIGDKLPFGFTLLRGAAYLATGTISLIYRRHFWYIVKHDIVLHVYDTHKAAHEKWNELNEAEEA